MQALRNTLTAGTTGQWYMLFAAMVAVYLLIWLNKTFGPRSKMARLKLMEGFVSSQTKQFERKTGGSIYDEFYADVYDELFFQPNKHKQEIHQLL